jgi:hypothetical protein
MATPYDFTFTMVAGGITITWNARPPSLDYDPNLIIGIHPIPGGNRSAIQHFGHGGFILSFASEVYNITAITMTGAVNAQDIVAQLQAWARAGTLISLTTDMILEINGAVAMDVTITEFGYAENPGHPHDYSIRVTVQEFKTGSAL